MRLEGIFTTIKPSSPHPETFSDFPEDMDDWGCTHWERYYKRNKSKAGKQAAKDYFLNDLERIGTFANVHLCKYDCGFVKYMVNEGVIDKGDTFFLAELYCDLSGATVNAGETVKNTTKTTKYLAYGLPILVLGGVAWKFGLFKT